MSGIIPPYYSTPMVFWHNPFGELSVQWPARFCFMSLDRLIFKIPSPSGLGSLLFHESWPSHFFLKDGNVCFTSLAHSINVGSIDLVASTATVRQPLCSLEMPGPLLFYESWVLFYRSCLIHICCAICPGVRDVVQIVQYCTSISERFLDFGSKTCDFWHLENHFGKKTLRFLFCRVSSRALSAITHGNLCYYHQGMNKRQYRW